MSDIYLSSIFRTSTVYAHWNNCIPAEARTGIIIAVTPHPQELARFVTSPLTWQCYGGIKRQRKTITDPLTLISQTSGRWEKSTYRVWNGSADWASAGFFILRAGGMFERGSDRWRGFTADIYALKQIL